MSPITTHVLDLECGAPAADVGVTLEIHTPDKSWVELSSKRTDADGRVKDLLGAGSSLDAGRYRLTFDTGAYFAARKMKSFYRSVPVEFEITEPGRHYHVPLLLSPFGYSTYRGS